MSRLSKLVVLVTAALLSIFLFVLTSTQNVSAQTSYPSSVTYNDSSAGDQDDMAIWVHPTDRSKSKIISSDKHNDIFVYELDGSTKQKITEPSEPGNIDVRYNFPLGGQLVDIVGFNHRVSANDIWIYKVDPNEGTLTRVDDGNIKGKANYGFCLYHSKITGKFYAFKTAQDGNIQQFELFDKGGGQVGGTMVREFDIKGDLGTASSGSQTEGCVADDDNAVVYMAEEGKNGPGAIWKYSAEPSGGSARTMVDRTGSCSNNQKPCLDADVEGVTIYHTGDGRGYIIASSQGPNEFDVYQRTPPHDYVTTFKISGASSTDGIDVTSVPLGPIFPQGVFLAHSGGDAVFGTPWQTIADPTTGEGLTIDTSWDPRSGVTPPPPTGNPTATPTPTPTTPPGVTNTPTPPPGACLLGDVSWQSLGIGNRTGIFTVEFDSTPSNTSVDGVIGLSSNPASNTTDLATIVRFNSSGRIDVRDGNTYRSDITINYQTGVNYRFRMVVDTYSRTYSVYVRTGSSSEVRLALNYNFQGGTVVNTPTPTGSTPKATNTPTPTGPTPTLPPPPNTGGIWISRQEIMALPTSGSAWSALTSAANSIPSIGCSHGTQHEVHVMAAALVAVRTNNSSMYRTVANELEKVANANIQNNCSGNSLSLTRTMSAYPLAADIINLKDFDPAIDNKFRNWLRTAVYNWVGHRGTQIGVYEDRPNNHGTQAGVVVSATAIYLGDNALLQRSAQVMKGWLGDRSSYANFNYGDLCWQSNPGSPVGINPKGATRNGNNVDGVLPDDQRRGGCGWPPANENYVYGGLQGAVANAWILYRAGYDVFNWEDRALLRALQWQYNVNDFPAGGDDRVILPVIDKVYGSNFWGGGTVGSGKLVGWTDWTHQ